MKNKWGTARQMYSALQYPFFLIRGSGRGRSCQNPALRIVHAGQARDRELQIIVLIRATVLYNDKSEEIMLALFPLTGQRTSA